MQMCSETPCVLKKRKHRPHGFHGITDKLDWMYIFLNASERITHVFVCTQDDIYMFGGKLEAGSANVTDEMWAFNIPRRTWSLRKPAPPPPYALEGHTAHVVELADGEPVMLIFFGYSPIYSYINKVQEYNISECTCWLGFFFLSVATVLIVFFIDGSQTPALQGEYFVWMLLHWRNQYFLIFWIYKAVNFTWSAFIYHLSCCYLAAKS